MTEGLKIICPNCGAVVAVAPAAGLAEDHLVCGQCGTELRGAGPLEKVAAKVKDVVRKAERSLEQKDESE